jgi:putative redox protein
LPYDLLLAALDSCTSLTVAMSARTKKRPLEGVALHPCHSKVHAADCQDCESRIGRRQWLRRLIAIGVLEQLAGLLHRDARAFA